MSSIDTIRDSNGRPFKYIARYRTPDGASRMKTFTKKADADTFLGTIAVSTANGTYIDAAAGRVTFGEYAAKWVESQPHRASTAASMESMMKVHIVPTFGARRIASVRPSEVQAWVAGLDLAPSTVRVVYGKVAAIFAAAVEDRVIPSSPCTRRIRLPRLDGAEVTPMSPAEVRAMVEAVGERYRAFVVLMAGTGLRPAEALGLTVDRVDFLRRTIRVDRQLVTISGKVPTFGPCKTTSSVRTIPVPQAVVDELARHLEHHSPGPDGLIFTDGKGDPIRRNALGHLWRRAVTKVNAEETKHKRPAIVVDRTPHDLRHYAASVMIHEGASVKAVQRHLGHGSATTTLDTYAHLWPDSEDITRRALETGLSQIVLPACYEATAEG